VPRSKICDLAKFTPAMQSLILHLQWRPEFAVVLKVDHRVATPNQC
jgi:hypothetical protein